MHGLNSSDFTHQLIIDKPLDQLAKCGDLDSIVEVAHHLQQTEGRFANKLLHLAEGFQVKQLQTFIRRYFPQ